MEKIKVSYRDNDEILKTYSFNGEWLVNDIRGQHGSIGGYIGYYSAAKTKGNKIFILWKDTGMYQGWHEVVDSFTDIKEDDDYDEEFLSALAKALDEEYEICLDI